MKCKSVRACWNASVYRDPRVHVAPPRVRASLRAFIKLWHITCIAHFLCHCTRRSQNAIMACDTRESIQWMWFAFLFADISFASSSPLIVFESDASKPDSNPQFVLMLHENNTENDPHTRSPPINQEVSNSGLKFHSQTLPLILHDIIRVA